MFEQHCDNGGIYHLRLAGDLVHNVSQYPTKEEQAQEANQDPYEVHSTPPLFSLMLAKTCEQQMNMGQAFEDASGTCLDGGVVV